MPSARSALATEQPLTGSQLARSTPSKSPARTGGTRAASRQKHHPERLWQECRSRRAHECYRAARLQRGSPHPQGGTYRATLPSLNSISSDGERTAFLARAASNPIFPGTRRPWQPAEYRRRFLSAGRLPQATVTSTALFGATGIGGPVQCGNRRPHTTKHAIFNLLNDSSTKNDCFVTYTERRRRKVEMLCSSSLVNSIVRGRVAIGTELPSKAEGSFTEAKQAIIWRTTPSGGPGPPHAPTMR